MWCWRPTLSLFAFDGRMALAALWVIPVSAAIVMGSYRVQDKVQAKTMAAKIVCADGIQEALSRLIKHKTVLIIAHRMRTVAGADQVVVLSGGIVAEQGSPAELYARKGLYTHMVDLQSASQNWTI